ncbi:uncharacterized protein LOC110099350 [Dendrobium catenatum]|uniref:Transcriptional regulator of RNA polII, SAGA, subunit n=1 Tax=Dendrobium catenatum TaxID=906689 RepID=A0A2I0X5X6_9ASPA|nr:uncharacterized protein LOC110099350 [Dendrobium catenatum]XP_028549337.1 uncharacterized protein LOC110099350 [Dendrobium catenatum]PKU83301.1 hypothetical protein MA16_Dca023636 [Dendrobium catenatum]
MPPQRQFSRVDTLDLKLQISKKLGRQKAEKYFFNLRRLLNLKLSKMEFDRFCFSIMGKENVGLHNLLIRSILSNACFSHGPPSRHATTGNSRSTITSNGQFSDILPVSPRKGRSITSRDRRLNDRPSPLGPHGKMPSGNVMEFTNSCDVQRSREQQSAPELISIGSKALLEVLSVEDGEEVEQVRGSPSIQSRSPIRAPLGIVLNSGGLNRRALPNRYASILHLAKSEVHECCRISSMLPDMLSLRKCLERKLETEGLDLSVDYVNLLNHALDAYLKKMIKPCLELARSRSGNNNFSGTRGNFQHGINGLWHGEDVRNSSQCYSASMTDFRVAMQSNPRVLGVCWPVQLEKICIYSSEE